jgi:hypothetical protein
VYQWCRIRCRVYFFYQRPIFLVPFINSRPVKHRPVYCWQPVYQMHAPRCMSYYYAAPTRVSLGFVVCYVHRLTCLYEVICAGWKSAGLPWYRWAGVVPLHTKRCALRGRPISTTLMKALFTRRCNILKHFELFAFWTVHLLNFIVL